MAISESDILFYYSKGPDGISQVGPAASLGGELGSIVTTDKLFDNVTKDQTQKGIVDYRCIYIKNNSSTDALTNFDISITEYLPSTIQFGFDGVTIDTISGSITNWLPPLGPIRPGASGNGSIVTFIYKTKNIPFMPGKIVSVINILPIQYKITGPVTTITWLDYIDGYDIYEFTVNSTATGVYSSGGSASQQVLSSPADIQKITFNYPADSGRPPSGSGRRFYFVYENESQVIDWKDSIALQEIEIRNKIKNITRLANTVISVSSFPGSETYTLSMYNQRKRKSLVSVSLSYSLINSVPPPATVTYSVSGVQDGAPLNKITTSVISKFTKPNNITFLDATKNFTIDNFYPQDIIGMWFKRTVFPNTIPDDNDGFSINISADGDTISITPTPTETAGGATPTPTPTNTSTPTSTPTKTPTPTPTQTPTVSETVPGFTYPPTATPTPTSTGPFFITLSGVQDFYDLPGIDDTATSISWVGLNADQSITLIIYPEDFLIDWSSGAGLSNEWSFYISVNSVDIQVGSLSLPVGLVPCVVGSTWCSGSGRRQFTLNSTCTSLGFDCCPDKPPSLGFPNGQLFETISKLSTFPVWSGLNPPGKIVLYHGDGGYPGCP